MAYTVSSKFGRNVALAAIGTAVGVVGGTGLAMAAGWTAFVYGYECLDHAHKRAKSKSRQPKGSRRRGSCRGRRR